MSKEKTMYDTLGPTAIPTYPVTAWESIPKAVDYKTLWCIVGPQVGKHIRTGPLWKAFIAVYIEGLMHGKAVAEEAMGMRESKQKKDTHISI